MSDYAQFIHLAALLAFTEGSKVKSKSRSNTIYVVTGVTKDFVNFRIELIGGGVSLSHIEALTKMMPLEPTPYEDTVLGQFNLKAAPGSIILKQDDNNARVFLDQANLGTIMAHAMDNIK